MCFRLGRIFPGLAALAFAVAVAGCSPGSMSGSLTTAAANLGLDQIKSEPSSKVFSSAPEPVSGTWLHAGNYGVLREPAVEAYLGSILQRLMAHWHGDKPERVGIFLIAGDAVRAKATPTGDILIPIGAFDEIENEDQLAALIGHELGHIVLRHHEDERLARQLADTATTAVGIAFGVSSIKHGGMRKYGNTREYYIKDPKSVNRDTFRAMTAHATFVTITQDILLTAYSRDQEYSADVFGMRLSGRAGWDHRAILPLIQRWIDAEEAQEKQHAELMRSSGIVDGVMQAFGKAAAAAIATHPNAQSRRENAAKDMQASFKDAAPIRPTIAPYTASIGRGLFLKKRAMWRLLRQATGAIRAGRSDVARGKVREALLLPGSEHPDSRMIIADAVLFSDDPKAYETASRLLRSADLRQPATRSFYSRLAMQYIWDKRPGDALRIADLGERHHGRNVLPLRLAINRVQLTAASGEHREPPPQLVQNAQVLMARCTATNDSELIEECRSAASGRNRDRENEVCGGVITVIAALAPGGSNRCGQAGGKAATPNNQPRGATTGGGLQQIIGGILGAQ